MSPTASADHVASYLVLVDGEELAPEQRDRVKEVRVVDHLRLPDICTVHVTYPRGEGVDRMPFDIGKELEVRLGARDELVPRTLFRGHVMTIEPDFGAGGCHVSVRAFDRSHALHGSRRIRTFQNQTSSDVVQKILDEADIPAIVEASGEPHDFLQQDNETDWDFIWRLADKIGFEFVDTDDGMWFGPPDPDAGVTLEWPTTLRSFSPRVTAVQQVHEVTLSAQDSRTKQVIESSATSPNQIAQIGVDRATVAAAAGETKVHIATEPVTSKAEADAMTQALLDRLANGYVGAHGVAVGDPRLKAGVKVTVNGVGSRFSGDYRIARAEHVLRGGGGYVTHIANSPTHTLAGALGAATTPLFGSQLTIGIVTNNDDPDGQARVRVKFPALQDVEGAWARVVTLNAGDERGILMLPDIGDEVLVAFLHGDTRNPLVLGSLYNGVDKPGDVLVQDHNGSFVVRSAHRGHLESAEDLTLKSGAKLVVEVAKDASLTTDGALAVSAAGDITFKTDRGAVTVEGLSGLTLKCGGSKIELTPGGVTVSGPMISLG